MSKVLILSVLLSALPAVAARSQDAAPAASKPAAVTRVVGVVTAVDNNQIAVKSDTGTTANVKLGPATSYLRIPPGEKDLTKATRIAISEITVGDRVLARIRTAAEGQPENPASIVYLMNKAELAQHLEKGRAEWQRRGMAGKVGGIDPAAHTFKIQTQTATGLKDVTVQTAPTTGFRRYASDSIRFSDAKPSTISEIQVGDNLRVLGDRSEDGLSIKAEEIVSGSFRNIAGTILSIDAAKGEMRVNNLENKKPLVVKISADTTLKKLPPEMAAMMARMRQGGMTAGAPGMRPAGAPGGPGSALGSPADARAPGGRPAWAGAGGDHPGGDGGPGRSGPGGAGAGWSRGGGRDFQQMLERVPAVTLAELKTGDAVIISSSLSGDPNTVLAITLIAGVEPLLTAASASGQSVLNGSWNFGEVGLPQ